uniref:Uncharacterized protein n=1 Tax=Arundo donax TaxID=35708 RepID=A0A0A9HUR1_ARUDO
MRGSKMKRLPNRALQVTKGIKD